MTSELLQSSRQQSLPRQKLGRAVATAGIAAEGSMQHQGLAGKDTQIDLREENTVVVVVVVVAGGAVDTVVAVAVAVAVLAAAEGGVAEPPPENPPEAWATETVLLADRAYQCV